MHERCEARCTGGHHTLPDEQHICSHVARKVLHFGSGWGHVGFRPHGGRAQSSSVDSIADAVIRDQVQSTSVGAGNDSVIEADGSSLGGDTETAILDIGNSRDCEVATL